MLFSFRALDRREHVPIMPKYFYNVQVSRSLMMSDFLLVFTQTLLKPASNAETSTFGIRRWYIQLDVGRAENNEACYVSLKKGGQSYIGAATGVQNFSPPARLQDPFAAIFKTSHDLYVERPSLYHSAARETAAEVCNILLLRKQCSYQVFWVSSSTICII